MIATMVQRESDLTALASGFRSGVAPRWFEGLLWFSDPIGEAVCTVDLRGSVTALPLTGHAPVGLGFRPDGSLLISSAFDRQILRYDGETVGPVADLTDIVPGALGDMVVDDLGRAYIGCQAAGRSGAIVRLDIDGAMTVVAEDLETPKGIAISGDRKTLIVAESDPGRLTAFSIADRGQLFDRRIFAEEPGGAPTGVALDAAGGVWTATSTNGRFERVVFGGKVTDCIETRGNTADACALGGPGRRILFLMSSAENDPRMLLGARSSRVDAVKVDIPGAGSP